MRFLMSICSMLLVIYNAQVYKVYSNIYTCNDIYYFKEVNE
jgi:hypothetical protein